MCRDEGVPLDAIVSTQCYPYSWVTARAYRAMARQAVADQVDSPQRRYRAMGGIVVAHSRRACTRSQLINKG